MTSSSVIASPHPDSRPRCPSAHLSELEQRVANLWSTEPHCSTEQRTAAFEALAAIEHRLSSLALRERVTGRLLDRRFQNELNACESDLDEIALRWSFGTE